MITMTIVVKVRPEKREEFLQAIRSLNAAEREFKGLRRTSFHEELDSETDFSLVYEWETQRDLDQYSDSDEFKVLLGALKVLGERSEITYTRFH